MMKIKFPVWLLFCLLSDGIVLFAQLSESTINEPTRILHKHYGSDNLLYLKTYKPVFYDKITGYFMQTFEVYPIDGSELNRYELFSVDLFDVSQWEQFRSEDVRETFTYLDKYTITLFSKQEVNNLLGDRMEEREMYDVHPVWDISWETRQDFLQYRRLLGIWKKHNQIHYQQLLQSSQYKQIPFLKWMKLSIAERELILLNEYGYEIVE